MRRGFRSFSCLFELTSSFFLFFNWPVILFAIFGLMLIFLLVRSMRNGNGLTGSMAA